MKHTLLLTAIIAFALLAGAQENKYYWYGSKFVHNEYLRVDYSEKKIYYKGENNKAERVVKIINGNYIVPGKGKCIITTSDGNVNITTEEGEEYTFRKLQSGDKPGKEKSKRTKLKADMAST